MAAVNGTLAGTLMTLFQQLEKRTWALEQKMRRQRISRLRKNRFRNPIYCNGIHGYGK